VQLSLTSRKKSAASSGLASSGGGVKPACGEVGAKGLQEARAHKAEQRVGAGGAARLHTLGARA